jgi:hypothetical protein
MITLVSSLCKYGFKLNFRAYIVRKYPTYSSLSPIGCITLPFVSNPNPNIQLINIPSSTAVIISCIVSAVYLDPLFVCDNYLVFVIYGDMKEIRSKSLC